MINETIINVCGLSTGYEFAGFGSVSVATDVLLVDYEDAIRKDILNFLFKEKFGMELKLLKVEIGGGGNDTNIANASHMPTREIENYYAGYSWKLLKEVKEINPNVKLMGLHWSMPNWVKTPIDEAYYIYKWVRGMREVHGIEIDYIGGQRNEEEPMNPEFTIYLRKILNDNGFNHVKIVGGEAVYNKWVVADLMHQDPDYNAAIDIIGAHYVGEYGPDKSVLELGKPLWESETPCNNPDYNSFGNVRKFIKNYVEHKISGMQVWGLSGSVYANSWWHMIGMISAKSPWSGYWQSFKHNLGIAHINQFADFGWTIIDTASGKLTDSESYFMTIKSPDNDDYNLFIETLAAKESQSIVVRLTNGIYINKKVNVWSTNTNSDNDNEHFIKESEITPINGEFSYLLKPGYIYNFVTTTGHSKKGLDVIIKPEAMMTIPIMENFEQYHVGHRPKYFIDMEGTFEVAKGNRGHNVLRQVSVGEPVRWYGAGTDSIPYALFGDHRWTDYQASIEVCFESAGYMELAIRASEAQMKERLSRKGYYIRLHSDGKWEMLLVTLDQINKQNVSKVLETGNIAGVSLNEWYKIGIKAIDNKITGYINDKVVANLTDDTHQVGNIFLSTSSYNYYAFDNLLIEEVTLDK